MENEIQLNLTEMSLGCELSTMLPKRRLIQLSMQSVTLQKILIAGTMLRQIQPCTEAEARQVLAIEKWSMSIEELGGFISKC